MTSTNESKALQARNELTQILNTPEKIVEVKRILIEGQQNNDDMNEVLAKFKENLIQPSDLGGYQAKIETCKPEKTIPAYEHLKTSYMSIDQKLCALKNGRKLILF